MDLYLYRTIHIGAALLLFMAYGGAAIWAVNAESPIGRKLVAISHGIALVLLLVTGFGGLAKLGLTSGLPLWVWGKFALWLILGGLLFVVRRKPALATIAFACLPVLGAAAAALAIYKPA